MYSLIFVFVLTLPLISCNLPDIIYCTPNNTDIYIDAIDLTLSPFPIPLEAGETVAIQFSFDVIKEIPIGSTVQIRLVEQGAIPTPLPCFPVITTIIIRGIIIHILLMFIVSIKTSHFNAIRFDLLAPNYSYSCWFMYIPSPGFDGSYTKNPKYWTKDM